MKRDLYNVYPLIGVTGDFTELNPVENIAVEILSVLVSPTGETSTRMWNIDFGSKFMDYLFELDKDGIEQAIANEVINAVRKNLDDVVIEVKNVEIVYSYTGKVVNIKLEIGFEYDDKEYIVIYNLPHNNEMLLDAPIYSIHPTNSEVRI